MINKNLIFLLGFLSISLTLTSQVDIDKPILFISTNESDRTVEGIETTTNIDLLNSKEVIINEYQYAQTILANDTIFADFSPNYENLEIGFKVFIKLPSTSTNDINYIQIDNLKAKRVFLHLDQSFNKEEIKDNEILTIIYDGVAFQTMRQKKQKACPTGFVSINDSYCVSQFRQGPGVFKDNIDYCNSLNARLCSWAEWFYACENYATQITDMSIAGNEWIDTGGNGANSAKVAGNSSCKSHGFSDIQTGSFYFRCCYSKK